MLEEVAGEQKFVAPSPGLLFMEARTGAEFGAFMAAWPSLLMAPRGEGRPVLVLPPFGVSDRYTQPLRFLLQALGYRAEGWELGHNLGRTPAVVDGIPRRLLELHDATRLPVSIVGWSMGGVLARELAREYPGRGAPGHRSGGTLPPAPRRGAHEQCVDALRDGACPPSRAERVDVAARARTPSDARPLHVDLLPDRRRRELACMPRGRSTADAENIEVVSSHCGLGHNVAAVIAVLDRLGLPEGEWAPFTPPAGSEYLYPAASLQAA